MKQASAQVQADRDLIVREHRKAELDEQRRDLRNRLQDSDVQPRERELIHALLRESYRRQGFSDDVIYACGVWRKREPGK